MSPNERMQADARKVEILKASLGVFAIKGFAATTTKDLAAAAGVSEGLLYKHFPGKENLYQELGRFICGESTPVSSQLVRIEPSTGSLVQGIYYLTRMVLSGPCGAEEKHEFLLRMMSRSLLEDGIFATAFMEGAFLPYVGTLQAWFEAARKAGDLHTEAPSDRFAIFFAHHLVVGIRLHSLRKGAEENLGSDPDALRREIVLYNLRGAGLKDAAIRKHLDFKKLDSWFAGLFGPSDPAPVPVPKAKARSKK